MEIELRKQKSKDSNPTEFKTTFYVVAWCLGVLGDRDFGEKERKRREGVRYLDGTRMHLGQEPQVPLCTEPVTRLQFLHGARGLP